MKARTLLTVMSLLALLAPPAGAAEPPGKRDARGLPVGSYSTSCTCQISGGAALSCYCANLHAKWFRTALDVRSCPAPKDIKNCEGVLTCTASGTTPCAAEPLAPHVSQPIKAAK
jgi:hypothetical protein